MPEGTLRLLQGRGSVQQLDDGAHRHRKTLFLSLLAPEALPTLEAEVTAAWRRHLPDWQRQERLVLHRAIRVMLCDAACRWAGLPQEGRDLARRAEEFGAMIDAAGSFGPRHLHARWLRRRSETWAARALARPLPPGSPAAIIAAHRDAAGRPLPAQVAAVELINLLRPTVAIARFVVFAALALHRNPGMAARIAGGEAGFLRAFVQEVRRFYPFFPFVGGRARQAFDWRGRRFAPGDWVLLDLYGSNHDPQVWGDPERFRPERFGGMEPGPYRLIPQGAGHHATGHRCPGEWAVIALTGRLAGLLAGAVRYDVPAQDLRVRLDRMPALPESGFVIGNVTAAG